LRQRCEIAGLLVSISHLLKQMDIAFVGCCRVESERAEEGIPRFLKDDGSASQIKTDAAPVHGNVGPEHTRLSCLVLKAAPKGIGGTMKRTAALRFYRKHDVTDELGGAKGNLGRPILWLEIDWHDLEVSTWSGAMS
jgi:hypothetical protein